MTDRPTAPSGMSEAARVEEVARIILADLESKLEPNTLMNEQALGLWRRSVHLQGSDVVARLENSRRRRTPGPCLVLDPRHRPQPQPQPAMLRRPMRLRSPTASPLLESKTAWGEAWKDICAAALPPPATTPPVPRVGPVTQPQMGPNRDWTTISGPSYPRYDQRTLLTSTRTIAQGAHPTRDRDRPTGGDGAVRGSAMDLQNISAAVNNGQTPQVVASAPMNNQWDLTGRHPMPIQNGVSQAASQSHAVFLREQRGRVVPNGNAHQTSTATDQQGNSLLRGEQHCPPRGLQPHSDRPDRWLANNGPPGAANNHLVVTPHDRQPGLFPPSSRGGQVLNGQVANGSTAHHARLPDPRRDSLLPPAPRNLQSTQGGSVSSRLPPPSSQQKRKAESPPAAPPVASQRSKKMDQLSRKAP